MIMHLSYIGLKSLKTDFSNNLYLLQWNGASSVLSPASHLINNEEDEDEDEQNSKDREHHYLLHSIHGHILGITFHHFQGSSSALVFRHASLAHIPIVVAVVSVLVYFPKDLSSPKAAQLN